ncbi:MAG: PaaI family thioesterase [Eubacterium sp.]|nr:PaaI family thioesterase [Eubacterium sp.]
MEINIEEIREFFKNDRFATENGAIIDEVGENFAQVSLEIEPRHLNAVGGVMGGVPFMLSDFAFAVAANWKREAPVVSVNSNIAFAGAAKGKRLIARAECVKDGRSTCVYLIKVNDDLGNIVTETMITGFKKTRP